MESLYKDVFLGISYMCSEDGWTEPSRFPENQIPYWEGRGEGIYGRARSCASVKLEFYSRGGSVSFDYKILPGTSREYYGIDLAEDGELKAGVSENTNNTEGHFEKEIEKSEKEKRITIYFPATARCLIRNLKLPGDFTPHRRKKKILMLGDSKYQGYNPDNFCYTCMNVASDKFDADMLNLSIGGECFRAENLFPLDYDPDFIIVGFGVNDWACNSFGKGEKAGEYLRKAASLFQGKTIYVIIPPRIPFLEKGGENDDLLYKKKNADGGQTLEDVRRILEDIVGKTENAVSIDGRDLIPDEDGIFYSDKIHLTNKGNIILGNGIYNKLICVMK